ncbi:MAG: glycosidase, partial [Ignavibacterium sp.]|nr:glycosidase [Ignavibacterium sp.]
EEKHDEKIKEFYHLLFKITKDEVFRNGNWKLLEADPVSYSDTSYENLLAWEWRLDDELRIVVVNYNASTSRCRLKFSITSETDEVVLRDLLNNVNYKRSIKEISEKGLFVELKSFNSHIFNINSTGSAQILH